MDLSSHLALLALLLPVTLIALAIAGRRGCLSPDRLRQAPSRDIALLGQDVLMVAMLKLLGMIAGSGLIHFGIPGIPGIPGISDDANGIALATLLIQLLSDLLPLSYIAFVIYSREKAGPLFGLGRWSLIDLRSGVLGLLLALPMVMTLSTLGTLTMLLLGEKPPDVGHDLLNLLARPDAKQAAMFLSVSAVLIAPLGEEIIYRGWIQTWLLRKLGEHRRLAVITITAALFALVHLGSVPAVMLPPLLALGWILGWLYETTGRLAPCIILHALFNAINLLLAAVVMN